MTPRYEPREIETKWQRVWEDEGAFHVPNPVPGAPTAENHWYQLEMLPYPSAPSIHMGHVLNYTMGDVQTHVRRRSGWHVVRPMGWDAFGLPAENAAIKEGRHPRVTIEENIDRMRAQMKRLGWAIDWDREVAAHQPTFYRWTQWLFQQFVANDLCYRREGPVNWCPNDQTVIANEYVVDGKCERCGAEVELRNMTQWYMRTTAYADELLDYPGG
jgi:leucyl-tRNA synthetase